MENNMVFLSFHLFFMVGVGHGSSPINLIGHYSFSFRNGDQLFGSKITFSTFKLHTINLFLFSYKLIVWLEE